VFLNFKIVPHFAAGGAGLAVAASAAAF